MSTGKAAYLQEGRAFPRAAEYRTGKGHSKGSGQLGAMPGRASVGEKWEWVQIVKPSKKIEIGGDSGQEPVRGRGRITYSV